MTTDAHTAQWQAHRDKWMAEAPAPHEFTFARSHRRPRRISLGKMVNIFAATLAAFFLMTYAVAMLWETGVPLTRLLPALAALVVSGVVISAGVMSR